MDSAAAQSSVIYSVELARKGRPLGITIASAGGILDPIVISQLAPGGLAERFFAEFISNNPLFLIAPVLCMLAIEFWQ
jgi:hypothetical protein